MSSRHDGSLDVFLAIQRKIQLHRGTILCAVLTIC
jgi:hypothetical protein